ncbi:DUF5363 family protein [Gallibacterium trehalosifermentans]|uniref:DUF5363 family protein n=1 Tax=Gallibacterium trehalosifermentans TaxID=516935 RepID=A0ABV6H374_9PAST
MTQEKQKQPGLFKKLLKKYDDFCKELGVDQGACRSCVPIYKQDPELVNKNNTKDQNV